MALCFCPSEVACLAEDVLRTRSLFSLNKPSFIKEPPQVIDISFSTEVKFICHINYFRLKNSMASSTFTDIMQLSAPSSSRTFSLPQQETPHPLSSRSSSHPLPYRHLQGNHSSTLRLYGNLITIESCNMSDFFDLVSYL